MVDILAQFKQSQARRAGTELEHLEQLGDALAGVGLGGQQPTIIHVKAIDVLTKLVALGNELADDETPIQLRVMMRGLETLRPLLLEMFAKVPPDVIVGFMRELGEDVMSIVHLGDAEGYGRPKAIEAPAAEVPLPSPHDEQPAADSPTA